MRLRPQLCPGPRWGAHDAPLDSLAGWEGGTPFPHPTPLGAELEPRAFSSRPVVESKKILKLYYDQHTESRQRCFVTTPC